MTQLEIQIAAECLNLDNELGDLIRAKEHNERRIREIEASVESLNSDPETYFRMKEMIDKVLKVDYITRFRLYDSRYTTDPNSSVMYCECDTIEEAIEDKNEDFPDALIVKEVMREKLDGSFMVISSEIVEP